MKASIDIGTNTALLLVGRFSEKGLEVLCEEQRLPRLGQGVDQEGNLGQEAVSRTIRALLDYKNILSRRYPEVTETVVTATSAVRDAANRKEFVEKIKSETGFDVQILSGLDEARYTFYGAQSVLPIEDRPVLIIDIGGGSTEIAYGSGMQGLLERHSFDMGCVRFTERYLKNEQPSTRQVAHCRTAIADMLKENTFSFADNTILVGVAGTVTSLAHIHLGLSSYNESRLNRQELTMPIIRDWISYLRSNRAEQLLAEYPEVMEGRADIFLAGLLILEGVMTAYGFERLTVSTGGIRHGALLQIAGK